MVFIRGTDWLKWIKLYLSMGFQHLKPTQTFFMGRFELIIPVTLILGDKKKVNYCILSPIKGSGYAIII